MQTEVRRVYSNCRYGSRINQTSVYCCGQIGGENAPLGVFGHITSRPTPKPSQTIGVTRTPRGEHETFGQLQEALTTSLALFVLPTSVGRPLSARTEYVGRLCRRYSPCSTARCQCSRWSLWYVFGSPVKTARTRGVRGIAKTC